MTETTGEVSPPPKSLSEIMVGRIKRFSDKLHGSVDRFMETVGPDSNIALRAMAEIYRAVEQYANPEAARLSSLSMLIGRAWIEKARASGNAGLERFLRRESNKVPDIEPLNTGKIQEQVDKFERVLSGQDNSV